MAAISALVLATFIAAMFAIPNASQHLVDGLALTILIQGSLSTLALVTVARRRGVHLAALGCVRPTRRMAHLLWQVPLILLAAVLVQGMMVALSDGAAEEGGTQLTADLAGANPAFALAGFLGIALVTPFWEELAFRGLLFGSVRHRWGTTAAVLTTSIIFAAVHLFPLLMPYLIALGCGAAWLRLFHRNIWAPISLHVVVNSIAGGVVLTAL
ncbi:CPBP family intramembrane glutamic endopeptidase [Rothia santali]|uniref:CPBP family intramembrane glutamic endopeptidase n=1 Tax=Rothia santali TaxID=2949643 RepID=UPI0020B1F4F0|nr:CPBP family intramembrane glutamic endopeptidase [Rothia santali]